MSKPTIGHLSIYKSVVDDLEEGVCIIANSGKCLYVNNSFNKFSGFQGVDDFSSVNCLEKVLKDITLSKKIFDQILKGNKWEGSVKVRKKEGIELLARLKASPLVEERKITGGIFFFKEVLFALENGDYFGFLETLVENANDAVMVTDAEDINEPGPRILYVNHAFTKITGYSKEETIGRSPRFLQGKRTDRNELDKIRNALINKESVQVELINYTKSGNEFWVNFSLIPIWKNNRITHFASIQRETTVKRNLLLLITSILDAIPEKVAFVDTQGKIKASNKEWKEYCYQSGKANTDYLEVCVETFGLTGGDVEIIKKGLEDVISGKIEFFKKEIKHVAKTAQSFDILINPVNNTYPTDAVVLHIDITKRILSEERLQSSEEYYRSLFAHHPDAICSVDLEGKFTSVNDAVVNLTKIPKSKLLGSSFEPLIADQSLKELLTLFNKVLLGEPQNLETEVLMKNGHSYSLNITSIPIKINKKVTGLHSIIKDVTETKQSQRKIAEVANR